MSSVNLHSGTAEQHSSPSMVHGQSQYTAADKMSALSMARCRSDYSAAADMSTHSDEFAFPSPPRRRHTKREAIQISDCDRTLAGRRTHVSNRLPV
jgi:hypothetical protein